MTNVTLTLRQDDVANLLDAALVQTRVWESWQSMLNCTPEELELSRMKASALRAAREAVLVQVMP